MTLCLELSALLILQYDVVQCKGSILCSVYDTVLYSVTVLTDCLVTDAGEPAGQCGGGGGSLLQRTVLRGTCTGHQQTQSSIGVRCGRDQMLGYVSHVRFGVRGLLAVCMSQK